MISSWGMCLGGIAVVLAASVGAAPLSPTPTEDAKLVAAVRAAVKKGLAPGKVEATVGRRATLNTFRKEDEGPFQRADIAADADLEPALPERKSLRWVAYWVRPVKSRNPKIVGLAWSKKGQAQLFFGEVLPPR